MDNLNQKIKMTQTIKVRNLIWRTEREKNGTMKPQRSVRKILNIKKYNEFESKKVRREDKTKTIWRTIKLKKMKKFRNLKNQEDQPTQEVEHGNDYSSTFTHKVLWTKHNENVSKSKKMTCYTQGENDSNNC